MRRVGNGLAVVLLVVMVVMAAGCATTDQKVSMLYHPVAAASGASGDLYVADSRGKPDCCRDQPVLWVVGKVKDGSGENKADILSMIPLDDLLIEAYKKELNRAGYRVVTVPSLPAGVEKGVNFTTVAVNLEQTDAPFKVEAATNLQVQLELWKGGNATKRLKYQYSLSDSAVTGKDVLVNRVLEDAFQQMMKQSLPEMVQGLEGR